MRRLLPLPILFALLFAPLQTASNTAYACSCIETTLEERVQSADIVAIGTVISLYEGQSTDTPPEFTDLDAVVRVSAYYKGSGPAEIAVDDPPDGGTCGIITEGSVGREAVLYLELSDGQYLTHLCAGSHFISGNDEFLAGTIAAIEAVTGPGQPPGEAPPQDEPDVPAEPDDASTPWAIILPLAFAIPLAVLVVPALLRRRGSH